MQSSYRQAVTACLAGRSRSGIRRFMTLFYAGKAVASCGGQLAPSRFSSSPYWRDPRSAPSHTAASGEFNGQFTKHSVSEAFEAGKLTGTRFASCFMAQGDARQPCLAVPHDLVSGVRNGRPVPVFDPRCETVRTAKPDPIRHLQVAFRRAAVQEGEFRGGHQFGIVRVSRQPIRTGEAKTACDTRWEKARQLSETAC